jgi:hypothetical protein
MMLASSQLMAEEDEDEEVAREDNKTALFPYVMGEGFHAKAIARDLIDEHDELIFPSEMVMMRRRDEQQGRWVLELVDLA